MAEQFRHNDSADFVGIAAIKAAQRDELARFEAAADQGRWRDIHHSHYDWWMFPVDSPSRDGLKWTVRAGDIAELKQDPAFLRDYLRGVGLLMLAWGWDLGRQDSVPNPAPDQKWQRHPVRLYKAAYSLWLFGYEAELASLRKYALALIGRGESFRWNGKDLGVFFTQGLDPYSGKRLYTPPPI